MVYLNCLQVDQQIFWLEVCLAKAYMNIASLVCAVLNLASLEVPDCLQGAAPASAYKLSKWT
jgi:hypothetical protein